MKRCPSCGKEFNLWQRAVGEAKDHISRCVRPEKKKDLAYIAAMCRGCPAGCHEKVDYSGKE
jgi:hypothetical protein